MAFVLTNYVSVSGQVALHTAFVLTNYASVPGQVALHVAFVLTNYVSVPDQVALHVAFVHAFVNPLLFLCLHKVKKKIQYAAKRANLFT